MDSTDLDIEPIVCFECGAPIASIEARGVAVVEGIVLCERCCEQHESRTKTPRLALPSWDSDLARARHA